MARLSLCTFAVTCPNGCSGHGTCRSGQCECFPGFTYFDCSLRTCAGDCSGAGVCFNGTCRCADGFCGADCSLKCCVNGCSGRGECLQDGTSASCLCQPGYGGADCSLRVCPNNCSANGVCAPPADEPLAVQARWQPTCQCFGGFTGFDCSLKGCEAGCSGRGYCYNGARTPAARPSPHLAPRLAPRLTSCVARLLVGPRHVPLLPWLRWRGLRVARVSERVHASRPVRGGHLRVRISLGRAVVRGARLPRRLLGAWHVRRGARVRVRRGVGRRSVCRA